jgi:hypothetical protein
MLRNVLLRQSLKRTDRFSVLIQETIQLLSRCICYLIGQSLNFLFDLRSLLMLSTDNVIDSGSRLVCEGLLQVTYTKESRIRSLDGYLR